MLETILSELHNWFAVRGKQRAGSFRIVSGELECGFLKSGQYYRIRGSVFNDGLHRYPAEPDELTDEEFDGEIWPLAIPREVIALAEEIAEWREENPESDKISESFGGYSYTRAQTTTGGTTVTSGGWQGVFAKRLNPYRRPHE